MNLSLTHFLNQGNDWSFENNKVGYLYNIKAQSYFNCNNFTKRSHILPILTTIPSYPWKLVKIKGTGKHIFTCGNGYVIDIAWNDYITVYPKHGKINQQFEVEIVKKNKIDEIIIHFRDGLKHEFCFTSKMGRVLKDVCKNKNSYNSGQNWYWIPEKLMDEIVFKQMSEFLNT